MCSFSTYIQVAKSKRFIIVLIITTWVYICVCVYIYIYIYYLCILSFEVVGYGCMTCIGNSGPLPEPVVEAITQVNKRLLFIL